MQREIEEAAYRAQREIEDGRRIVVGVNAFREEGETAPPTLTVDPRAEAEQIERQGAFRASRDASRWGRGPRPSCASTPPKGRNLMPPLIEAVANGVTLGEIVSTLKSFMGSTGPAPEVKPGLSFVI